MEDFIRFLESVALLYSREPTLPSNEHSGSIRPNPYFRKLFTLGANQGFSLNHFEAMVILSTVGPQPDKKTHEPLFWAIFSADGVMTALFVPVQLFLFTLAFPLGWIESPSHAILLGQVIMFHSARG